jgi:hypothetical protein
MQASSGRVVRQITMTQEAIASIGPVMKGSISRVVLGRKTRSTGQRISHLMTYKGNRSTTRSVYVKKEQLKQARSAIANYKKLKKLVQRLLELNLALFRIRQSQ